MSEIPYNQQDHYHCWEYPIPPCGQKIEHLKCCLCEKLNPKAMSESNKCHTCGKRIYERGQTYTPGNECSCMSESNKQKIEAGAHDFANRFLPVMKELAEEEAITPSWEAEFNKEFGWVDVFLADAIKAFIQSLLDRQQAEAVALGESLKKNCKLCAVGGRHYDCPYAHFDEAITTYQKALEALNN